MEEIIYIYDSAVTVRERWQLFRDEYRQLEFLGTGAYRKKCVLRSNSLTQIGIEFNHKWLKKLFEFLKGRHINGFRAK